MRKRPIFGTALLLCVCLLPYGLGFQTSPVGGRCPRLSTLLLSLQPVPQEQPPDTAAESSRNLTSADRLREEAESLLAQARALRESLPVPSPNIQNEALRKVLSPWRIPDDVPDGVDYRLYLSIGREAGTWMDPRWGASGQRIDLTLDVRFSVDQLAPLQSLDQQPTLHLGAGQTTSVYVVHTAQARLRSGFDRMKCHGGAYMVETAKNGARTLRFYLQVDGTEHELDSSYGDVFIPKGRLYFAIPVLSKSLGQISKREGLVTIRQHGWKTGWWREESRIVGTVRAKAIDEATSMDGF